MAVPTSVPAGWIALAALLLAGCTAAGEEVQPRGDALFFPTGLAVTPDESTLFVVNSNSNLRFDSGTVLAFDLEAIDQALEGWLADGDLASGCSRDEAFSETMQCDEVTFLMRDADDRPAAVRTGNFATDIGVQELASGALRLLLPVRGDPSVTWIDWDAEGRRFDCGEGSGVVLCDDEHRLGRLRENPDLAAIDFEPYGIYVDSGGGYAVVTHLTSATVTLIDAPRDGSAPVIADKATGLFAANGLGQRVALGVAGRTPGQPDNLLYVTSRTESRVQTLTVYRDEQFPESLPVLLPGAYFFLSGVQGSDDSRGIAFNGDGSHAFVVNRATPALHILDTERSVQGFPVNTLDAAVEICREASGVTAADLGGGDRAWVTCFGAGQVWSVDPGRGLTQTATTVGRGPFAIEVAIGRQRAYVTNFLEDTIAVMDLRPGSPTEHRVVLRLGAPREAE